jgi:serine protease AprX
MALLVTVVSLVESVAAARTPGDVRTESEAARTRVQPFVRLLIEANPDAVLPLIVQVESIDEPQNARVRALQGRVTGYMKFIRAFRVELPARAIPSLAAQEGIRSISYDGRVWMTDRIAADRVAAAYPFAAGADHAWQSEPALTGRGIAVAVIDTGVTAGPDLTSVTHVVINGAATGPEDWFGHGTHVAGIIAGNGTLSDGEYVGIAPGASIVSLKVSDDDGRATEYHVIKALEWLYHEGAAHGVRVVNLSLSSGLAQGYDRSPLCAAVERVWSRGIIVVVSAGNRGAAANAVHFPPANDPFVITVGAVTDMGTRERADDSEREWSARGLTQHLHVKPDVMAPGSRIVSLLSSADSYIGQRHPDLVVSPHYLRLGGTSMAAPVVAGVAALMLEADPLLEPDQVKWILMNTTRPFRYQSLYEPGVIRAEQAVFYSRRASPQRANVGLIPSAGLGGSGQADWETAYWETAYWETAYWETAYWNHAWGD